ncbi:MAG: hypothetical protein HOB82_07280 [Alphaproteobacteria bacterium]|jgi:hypothetical protein|nr:hypothetical protein [Alphaproteobacteria bacterium]
MAREASDERLIIEFGSGSEVLELEELSMSISALARQYAKVGSSHGFGTGEIPHPKLLVTRIHSSQLLIEVAQYLGVIGIPVASSMVDHAAALTDFVEKIRKIIQYFSVLEERPENLDPNDVKDLETFIRPLAGRKGARLGLKRAKFHKESGDRVIDVEYEFNEQDLAGAYVNMGRELEEGEPQQTESHEIVRNVRLRWFQANSGGGVPKGRTGDLGIIPAISDRPLKVYFPTKDSVDKLKMTQGHLNPLTTTFLIDIDVTLDETGEPKSYTVLRLQTSLPDEVTETSEDEDH